MLILFIQGCAYAHDKSMLQNHISFKYTASNLKHLNCFYSDCIQELPYTLKDLESIFQLRYASVSYGLMGISMGLVTQRRIPTGTNI